MSVSAHDTSGNAFLIETVNVIPIDNRGDITPPSRLAAPTLSDRPDDVGDGLNVDFELSLASDVEEYLIFADRVPFNDASSMEPAVVVSRSPDFPVGKFFSSMEGDDSERLPLSPEY